MLFTVVTVRRLLSLLLLAYSTYFVMWYLSSRKNVSDSYVTDQKLRLPDLEHPVVTSNCLRHLSEIKRGTYSDVIKRLNAEDAIDLRNRTIVLRYRTNTSTILDPAPHSGRLSVLFMGRTGNKMYKYAGLYGVARRNGMRHVISANNPLLTLFRLNATVVPSDRPGRDWVQYVAEQHGYDKHTEYLDPRIDVEFFCPFRSWKYFAHVMRDLVENHFRFREDIQQEADNFLRRSLANFSLSSTDVTMIAVHIRRTDLLIKTQQNGYSNSTANRAYFRHAVAFFNRLFNNKTMYVVCSDDIDWSKKNFVNENPTVFSVGHSANVDFAILSRCNHTIITMGTFGEWAAYMAGGVTVYHKSKAPADVPLDSAYRKILPGEDPRLAWIALS